MALQERLQILVTADAKGAAREFEKVGAAADRNLGKADDRVQKLGAGLTSFGSQAVLAAGVAGAGLFKVAESASAYGEQISRATKTFGEEAVPGLEEFAATAAETAGISKTAATQAASTFAAFGKQIGLAGAPLAEFSTGLVQAAGDFSSFQDISSDEALTVFISALSGEQEAIKRYGIDLSAAAVEQEALNSGLVKSKSELDNSTKVQARYNLLMKESSLFAGDFVDTSDSLANRQRQLAAEFENAKIALGEGLLPLAEGAVGAIQNLGGAFGGAEAETQSFVGRVAGIAVATAGAVGGLSLAAGGAIKLRDRFTTLTGTGDDASRSINNVGRAAGALGAITIGAGIITGLYQITNDAKAAADAINGVKAALNQDDNEAAVRRLIESTKEIDGTVEDVLESIVDLRSPNIERYAFIDGLKTDIFDLKTQFEAITDAEEGFTLIDTIRDMGVTGRGADTLNTILSEQEQRFEDLKGASEDGADAVNSFGNETSFVGGVLKKFESGLSRASGEQDGFSDSLKDSLDAFTSVSDASESLSDAYSDLADARREAADLNGGRFNAREEADALRDVEDAARGLDDAYRSLEDAQRSVQDARIDLQRANEDLAEGLNDLAGVTVGSVEYDEGQDKLTDLRRSQEDASRGVEDAQRREQDAVRGVADAKRAQADAEIAINDRRIAKQDQYREATDRVAEAEKGVFNASRDLYFAQLDLADAVAKGEISVEDAKGALLLMAQDAPPAIQEMVASMVKDFDAMALSAIVNANKAALALGSIELPDLSFPGIFGGGGTSTGRTGPGILARPAPNFLGGFNAPARGQGESVNDWLERSGVRIPGISPGRASGGPVEAGQTYEVGEVGRELFVPASEGFIKKASDTERIIERLGQPDAPDLTTTHTVGESGRHQFTPAEDGFIVRATDTERLIKGYEDQETDDRAAPTLAEFKPLDEDRIAARATGGPVAADDLYTVNERGGELFSPRTNGFVMSAQETNRLLEGLDQLVQAGGSSRPVTNLEPGAIIVTAPGPEQAASATVRRMRSEEFLRGGSR